MVEIDLSGVRIDGGLRTRRIASDYIVDALREAIRDGTLPDGAVLNQVAIAERFGVSRVPVREAMRQLQAEGLISAHAHRRAVVRTLGVEGIAEIYDVRGMLEGYLAERAVPEVDTARLRRLQAIEHEMREVADHARWLKLNARFHDTLYEPSGAEIARELSDQLRTRVERYVNLWTDGRGIQRNREAGKEHREILDAVSSRDAQRARQLIERHILHTRDQLIDHYAAYCRRRAAPPALADAPSSQVGAD